MTDSTYEVCPRCEGKKIIYGTCECDSEWRGQETDDGWMDCQCTPDLECPTCKGAGFV